VKNLAGATCVSPSETGETLRQVSRLQASAADENHGAEVRPFPSLLIRTVVLPDFAFHGCGAAADLPSGAQHSLFIPSRQSLEREPKSRSKDRNKMRKVKPSGIRVRLTGRGFSI